MRSWASTGARCSTLCTLRRLLRTMGGVSSLTTHRVITERDGHQYSGRREPCTQKTPSVQSAGRLACCPRQSLEGAERADTGVPSDRGGGSGADTWNSLKWNVVSHSQ